MSILIGIRRKRGINDASILEVKNNSEYFVGDCSFVSNCGWGSHVFVNYGHCMQTMASFIGLLYVCLQCL